MSDATKPDQPPTAPKLVPKPAPTLGELLIGNLKIVAWSLALAAGAYAVWRGAAWLFPDVAWLQMKR
tara:strand:+ start:2263 stop:2463 length:201 start_codon:yes stop_codon:yes gene_type:complete